VVAVLPELTLAFGGQRRPVHDLEVLFELGAPAGCRDARNDSRLRK
jgi:hypothetical protein